MSARDTPRKGRGAASNRSGRFEAFARSAVDDGWGSLDEPLKPLRTELLTDRSRTVLAFNDSPDVPFDRSVNPYRGCEHGCVYCYARPTHTFLGLSAGLDFESKIFHKPDAPEQLARELAAPGYVPAPIGLGANTDPYQPLERRLGLTRRILELLARCRHPVRVVTKSALVERDMDLLRELAERRLCSVSISVTTLDRRLSRLMEPRAAAPERRLTTIARLASAGIPTHVLVAPVIPALNDAELESILARVRDAGATGAGYVLLRLPLEVRDLFVEWLETHYPERASRVMSRLRECRGGREYDSRFGARMRGTGVIADLIRQRFRVACRRLELDGECALDASAFRPPELPGEQLRLL